MSVKSVKACKDIWYVRLTPTGPEKIPRARLCPRTVAASVFDTDAFNRSSTDGAARQTRKRGEI